MICHRILIIEDDVDLRETLKDWLEMQGFQVLTAGNGKEGLRVLEEHGAPCLILLDLMMPVMNGWEFLAALKSDHQRMFASVPISVVSAAADVTDVKTQYGCQVMKKPLNLDHLFKLASEHCEAC